MAVDVEDYQEILGINDRQQLATAKFCKGGEVRVAAV